MSSLLLVPRDHVKIGAVGGGGDGSFFLKGAHRPAISQLETHQLIAGALRSNPDAAREAGKDWDLPHVYGTYEEMIMDAEKIGLSYILIGTPNFAHFAPAKCALENGIPVFCEKPVT